MQHADALSIISTLNSFEFTLTDNKIEKTNGVVIAEMIGEEELSSSHDDLLKRMSEFRGH